MSVSYPNSYSIMYHNSQLKHVQMCPNVPKYVQICPTMSNYVQICPNMSNYVQICPNISKYMKTWQNQAKKGKWQNLNKNNHKVTLRTSWRSSWSKNLRLRPRTFLPPSKITLSLEIHLRVPIWVVDDAGICCGQVDSKASGPSTQQKKFGIFFLEISLDFCLAIFQWCTTIQLAIFVPKPKFTIYKLILLLNVLLLY